MHQTPRTLPRVEPLSISFFLALRREDLRFLGMLPENDCRAIHDFEMGGPTYRDFRGMFMAGGDLSRLCEVPR